MAYDVNAPLLTAQRAAVTVKGVHCTGLMTSVCGVMQHWWRKSKYTVRLVNGIHVKAELAL